MRGGRRFSQAISEGDGISVIVEVESVEAADAAEEAGAEALLVYGGNEALLRTLTGTSGLPVLFFFNGQGIDALEGADACIVEPGRWEDVWDELGLDELAARCELVYRITDEDELVAVLDSHDPEVLLLAPKRDGEEALEHVLGLLPDVPAGKLAVAELSRATADDVAELERAGVDAVIVPRGNVAELVGGAPPEL